ncbi:unnamed protein product [Closterium sp. NIES-54]
MVVYQLRNRKQSAFKDGVCFRRVLHPVTGADTDVIKDLVISHPGDRYRWRHVFQDPSELGRRFLVHFPALSCLLCGGQHYDINHDAITTERQNNIGKWNLTLGRVHRINGNCYPAIVLISTGGNREEWICTLVGCGKAKGRSFISAADHITSANHLIHLEQLGSAKRASLDKASLNNTKDYGI